MAKNENERITLLRNLVLGISGSSTSEDLAARHLLEEFIQEVDPSVQLDICKEINNGKTPWLSASYSVFYGLAQIEGLVRQERMLREKVVA